MENRFTRALRVLQGRPVIGFAVDELTFLDEDRESEADHSKTPPFDLAFGAEVPLAPPEKILADERFRVCVFAANRPCDCCGLPTRWLVLELRDRRGRWQNLVTMHETRLGIMLPVLEDVSAYLLEGREEHLAEDGCR